MVRQLDLYRIMNFFNEELGRTSGSSSFTTNAFAQLSRKFIENMDARFKIIKQNSSLNADIAS